MDITQFMNVFQFDLNYMQNERSILDPNKYY